MLHIGAFCGLTPPNAPQKRSHEPFNQFILVRFFPFSGLYRQIPLLFGALVWFLHFLPKDWNQRIHRAPDHGRAHARHAPKEVDDAL